jgi:hypothetical protein
VGVFLEMKTMSVECENVLLPSLGKTIKVLPFFEKEE